MRGDQNTLQGSAASMPKRRDGSWRPVTMGAGAKGAARLHNVPASPLSTMKPDVGGPVPNMHRNRWKLRWARQISILSHDRRQIALPRQKVGYATEYSYKRVPQGAPHPDTPAQVRALPEISQ